MAEYIEREAVLNILASKNAPWDGYQKVSELPIADVQPVKHGRWIEDVDGCVICSECSNPAEINGITGEFMESPYCNECGARMDGET